MPHIDMQRLPLAAGLRSKPGSGNRAKLAIPLQCDFASDELQASRRCG
jgi:hypothetical protein